MKDPNLTFSQLQFSFQALDTFDNFDLSASLWHGQFGRALREEVMCIQPKAECKDCMLVHQCDYAFLFYGIRPPDADMMRRYNTIPVPHIFRNPVSQTISLQKDEWITLTMMFIGKATEYLPKIIETLNNLAAAGLGKQRYKLALRQVVQQQAGLNHLLYADGMLLSGASAQTLAVPPVPSFIRLQFLTPYRSKDMQHKQQVTEINLAKLLMAIVRRISLLQQFYTQTPLKADFAQLKDLAESAERYCVAQDWSIKRLTRKSAKQKKPIYTSGIVGHFDLSLEGLEPLWAYLYLGQFLNVGQNASMGYGRYQILHVK